jgi:hypothetical protein
MKKLTYLVVLMFSLVLMSTSCSKDDDEIVPQKTLQELYPEWNGFDGIAQASPQNAELSITIVDNVVNISHVTEDGCQIYGDFDEINISGNNITFSQEDGFVVVTGTFTKNGSAIKSFTTYGISITEHTYVAN